jgi:tetratricopeptide (TPR) repeat protein
MEKPANDDKKDIVKLAHMFFHNSQWDKALLEYKKILAIDPDDLNTHNTLGDIHVKKLSFQLAYESYNKAASGFLSRNQTGKALQVYKKIIRLNKSNLPDDIRKQINFIQGYVSIGDSLKEEKMAAAIETLGEILKFRSDDPVAQSLLSELDNKIAQMPPSIPTYQMLGDAFLKNNMLEKAKQMIEKIKTIDPQNPAVRLHSAKVFIKQGSENEAKKEYLNLAVQALKENNLDQALEYSRSAVELKSVEAHYISGLIYFKQKKFKEAVVEFEKLLRFKVGHLGSLIHLGKSFEQLGQLEKAKEFFRKTLTVDKNNPEVQEAWIEFCVRSNDKETVIPNLMALIDKTVTKQNAEPIAKFSRIMIKLEPTLVFSHIKLIAALQATGDLYGTADAYCALASIYEKQNQFNEATQCLEKALKLNPANSEELQKALTWMKQRKLHVVSIPSLKLNVEEPIVPESSAPIEVSPTVTETWLPNYGFVESHAPAIESTPQNTFEIQMTIASTCAQHGLLKAAIEIYQQLLESNPNSAELQKKLIEVRDIYIKRLTNPNK